MAQGNIQGAGSTGVIRDFGHMVSVGINNPDLIFPCQIFRSPLLA